MLQKTKDLLGHKLAADDGEIGHIKDFYFDDQTWVIRYLVADTGSWLPGRLVLLSPHAFGKINRQSNLLQVHLSKKQIADSPSIETHKPVSRQYEIEYYRYYGLPAYWDGGAMWGFGSYPVMVPPPPGKLKARPRVHHREDKHLQNTQAVVGYHLQTVDGTIGHVSGFRVNDKSWAIRELVVETGHWLAGKEIFIATDKIERISPADSTVFVKLTTAEIQQTAEHALAKAGAGQLATDRLHS